jgi:para-aminobenzoate synthetase component I
MYNIHSHTIDYISRSDKYQSFAQLLSQEWSILLDSGEVVPQEKNTPSEKYKRFDILTFQPTLKLSFSDGKLNLEELDQSTVVATSAPLILVRELLKRFQAPEVSTEHTDTIPFHGGLLGYFSYDFGKEYLSEQANVTAGVVKALDDLDLPGFRLGLYQWALITDHQLKTTKIYNFGLPKKTWQKHINTVETATQNKTNFHPKCRISQWVSDQSFKQYSTSFNAIKQYILAGDCYQINYAQRFQAQFEGDIYAAYKNLAKANNAPFSSFIRFNDFQILSLSPERFIAVENNKVLTQPIKGTLPRLADPAEDRLQAEKLINSEKDRAENLMIVDLLRNDLSRTAANNSVTVSELFGHYRFESVHHLISTIESKLSSEFDCFDLLKTTLPGGSITGAPKIRAMQIIDELEPVKRGIYCGIIGYIDFNGKMDSNICIRTLLAKDNKLYCWAGGGLVADSTLQAEYQETFDKLSKILPVLERSETPTLTIQNHLQSEAKNFSG